MLGHWVSIRILEISLDATLFVDGVQMPTTLYRGRESISELEGH